MCTIGEARSPSNLIDSQDGPVPITTGRLAARPSARVAGIEGVRALAAAAVLVFHCWTYGEPGGGTAPLGPLSTYVMPHLALGVTLFFSLSGFLLYRPFAAALLRG